MNNKTIWITGASSGIGKSLALKFAQEGWKVAISARRENLLDEEVDRLINVDRMGNLFKCLIVSKL